MTTQIRTFDAAAGVAFDASLLAAKWPVASAIPLTAPTPRICRRVQCVHISYRSLLFPYYPLSHALRYVVWGMFPGPTRSKFPREIKPLEAS
ncbi:MAG: hypothetical protein JXR73_13990 [Candidatus Omnitrophica bacterium]|nr:hypothetical protein [Candidatus Omnitrophota bacterium]